GGRVQDSPWPLVLVVALLFFFTGPATTEIYTLSLHDALPIYQGHRRRRGARRRSRGARHRGEQLLYGEIKRLRAVRLWPFLGEGDRKSTRLNSSHDQISYAVFCLKKKINHLTRESTPEKYHTR